MEKLLFLLAIVLVTMALVSRTRLHRNFDGDFADETVTRNLNETQSPKSLGYAIQKVTTVVAQKSNPFPVSLPSRFTHREKSNAGGLGADANKDGINLTTSKYISEIQFGTEQSVAALEKGLAEASGPDAGPQKLALLQAALRVGNIDETRMRQISLREMTGTIVPSIPPTAILRPEETKNIETDRQIVTTAYKIYLNATRNPEDVLRDTLQVLNYQKDQSTHDLILYDCIARYPTLRSKFENQ